MSKPRCVLSHFLLGIIILSQAATLARTTTTTATAAVVWLFACPERDSLECRQRLVPSILVAHAAMVDEVVEGTVDAVVLAWLPRDTSWASSDEETKEDKVRT